MAPMIGGNHRRPETVGRPCKPPCGSSRSSPSLSALRPVPPPLVAECRRAGRTARHGRDPRRGVSRRRSAADDHDRSRRPVHLAAKPPNDLGSVTPEVLSTLQTLIATTDFRVIKSRPFTGDCPTAYDGQETIYSFTTPGGVETIASCTVAIDSSTAALRRRRCRGRGCQPALRRSAFGFGLEDGVPRLEQAPHVTTKHEAVHQPTERPERRRVLPVVGHHCPARHGTERVAMAEPRERATFLLIGEGRRGVHLGDPACHPPPQSEVTGSPGDRLALLDRPARPARDRALAGGGHRSLVETDVARKIEDDVDRSLDQGLEPELRHA